MEALEPTGPGDRSPKIPLEMYEIPGQASIAQRSFERYKKDKEQDENIRKQVKESSTYIRTKFDSIPKGERVDFVTNLLQDPDLKMQARGIDMILKIPTAEQLPLRMLALEKIRDGLHSESIESQKSMALRLIYAPEEEQAALKALVFQKTKEGLQNENLEVVRVAASMMRLASGQEKEELQNLLLKKVREGLESEKVETQKVATEMIKYVSQKEQSALVEQALGKDIEVQKVAIKIVKDVPQMERGDIVEQVLGKDIEVQKVAIKMIIYVFPPERQLALRLSVLQKIKDGLRSDDVETQKIALEMIDGLRGDDPNVRKTVMIMLAKYFPEEERLQIARENLEKGLEFQKIAIRMIKYLAEEKREEFVQNVKDKGLGDELIKSPLYNKIAVDDKGFKRQGFGMQRRVFAKTGSGTSLIGGELKDNTIIRHIESGSFAAWQKIYEDYSLWKENGFDYVPIEPIQAYKLNAEGQVDVFSGVLDLSLGEWEGRTSQFKEELEAQKKKITKIVEKQQIKHGHPHPENFCLRFFRDEKGNVDFSKIPRLYLIDFDESLSRKVNTSE